MVEHIRYDLSFLSRCIYWEVTGQLFFLWNFDYHFGNIFKEIMILHALGNPRHGKTIKNWAQRLNFNLSH